VNPHFLSHGLFRAASALAMLLLVLPTALRGNDVANSPEVLRVPLKKISGRPCVQATVNGHPLWLVIDTGSAVSVLEASAATACGLDIVPGRAVATGMQGTEALLRTSPYAVEIGSISFPARPWFVRQGEPKRPADWPLLKAAVEFNLLGMDRLSTTCRYLTLDSRKGEVVFGLRQRFRPEPGVAYTTVPLEMRRGLPYVELRAGAARFSCLLDTGSSVPLLLDPATASGLEQSTFRTTGGRPLGLGNQTAARTNAWSTTLPQVSLGTGILSKVYTLILPRPPALGYGALERAAVTIDFEERRLWIRH
jgi:predicted aspartyl protease